MYSVHSPMNCTHVNMSVVSQHFMLALRFLVTVVSGAVYRSSTSEALERLALQ